ncbi:unnamed protein product [Enterobius vermicularis]|uniref:Uncharacterized protein n=1 Tax=Enterobius vermicularis TaxID=51028 RepID=A0A0N4UVD9_ENTVE|nr:unnamed protein product [Enterobius vermicularis]
MKLAAYINPEQFLSNQDPHPEMNTGSLEIANNEESNFTGSNEGDLKFCTYPGHSFWNQPILKFLAIFASSVTVSQTPSYALLPEASSQRKRDIAEGTGPWLHNQRPNIVVTDSRLKDVFYKPWFLYTIAVEVPITSEATAK